MLKRFEPVNTQARRAVQWEALAIAFMKGAD